LNLRIKLKFIQIIIGTEIIQSKKVIQLI